MAIISSGSFLRGRTCQPNWAHYIFIYSWFKFVQTLAHICQEVFIFFSPQVYVYWKLWPAQCKLWSHFATVVHFDQWFFQLISAKFFFNFHCFLHWKVGKKYIFGGRGWKMTFVDYHVGFTPWSSYS